MKPSIGIRLTIIAGLALAYAATYLLAMNLAGPDPAKGWNGLMPALLVTYVLIPMISLGVGVLGRLWEWPWPSWLALVVFKVAMSTVMLWALLVRGQPLQPLSTAWFVKYATATALISVAGRSVTAGVLVTLSRSRRPVR